jgi:hypothetical protein
MKVEDHLEYPKPRKKMCEFLFLFFTYSLNMLHISQRSKGMCSNHNLGSIKLCNEMTIKGESKIFEKKMVNGWIIHQIDSCVVGQQKHTTCKMDN